MLVPSTAAKVQQFYAVGNTPANSLTRTLPHGVDAAILLLGCGDVRNVLYTALVEQGLPSRRLDITCCDYTEDVLARNILLYSFLIDGLPTDPQLDRLWDVYYHLYVDDETLDFLAQQVTKLVRAASSQEAWHASAYGRRLRFCDPATFRDLQAVLAKYSKALAEKDSNDYAQAFRKRLEKADAVREAMFGKSAPVLTGLRSVAPVIEGLRDVADCFAYYWRHGTTTTPAERGTASSTACRIPNPTFAASVNENLWLHYGTDPLLGFHLAPALVQLTEASPLRIGDDVPGATKLVRAARVQFRAMAKAFQAQRDRIVLRFVAADALAFCYTLQNCASSQRAALTANWYRRQFDGQRLALDPDEYGGAPAGSQAGGRARARAPVAFDVIDTSNLADHVGPLNVLVAGVPLLADGPSAALLTELLVQREDSEKQTFDALLCGHTPTVALLLGVTPAEYYTNTRSTSAFDDVVTASFAAAADNGGSKQLRTRLTWKPAHYFSGRMVEERQKMSVASDQLAATVRAIYREMFFYESPAAMIGSGSRQAVSRQVRKATYPYYHRGSLAAVLRLLRDRVATDWAALCGQLVDFIRDDRTFIMGTNYVQELGTHLHMWGVHSEPWMFAENQPGPASGGGMSAWPRIPEVVAVTLVVPRAALDRLFGRGIPEQASPTLSVGLFSADSQAAAGFHHMYDNVQLLFGTVSAKGARDSPDFEAVVVEDPLGWQGQSPLVACFHAPARALQIMAPTDTIALALHADLQSLQVYRGVADADMSVYATTLGDTSRVFVTRFLPGHSGYPAVQPPVPRFAAAPPSPSPSPQVDSTELTLTVDPETGRATSIAGRLRIASARGKRLLANKAVGIRVAATASPFVVDLVFGKKELVCAVHFPVAVAGDAARLRVARTSSWVEVVAALAEPAETACLQDLIAPATLDVRRRAPVPVPVPVVLSGAHVNLDALPIVDLTQRNRLGWLRMLAGMTFSARERELRAATQASASAGGISADTRLNVKESMFTLFMLAAGLDREATGLFAVTHPQRGGVHMLILVSALRLEGASGSVVADAAVVPLTLEAVREPGLQGFLALCQELAMATLKVDDAELAAWKKMLPSMAERCRAWQHQPGCAYAAALRDGAGGSRERAPIPLSLDFGAPVLCSCGRGKLPDGFLALPLWEDAAPHATRVAISPLFCVPFAEASVAPSPAERARAGVTETCPNCGATAAADGTPLKKCMRCQAVKYCSAACQRAHWRTHRRTCRGE